MPAKQQLDMKSLERMPLQKVAEYIHRDFVDSMHGRFGFAVHPGYCGIEVGPLFSSGGLSHFGCYKIHIDDANETQSAIFTTAHESAHYLHPLVRRYCETDPPQSVPGADRLLGEVVAYLGAIEYFSSKGQTAWAYRQLESRQIESDVTRAGTIALNLFEANLGNFSEIVASESMKAAEPLLTPHIKSWPVREYIYCLLRES